MVFNTLTESESEDDEMQTRGGEGSFFSVSAGSIKSSSSLEDSWSVSLKG